MNQSIEIDDDVYGYLKRAAEPFVDTPNSVLRRVLGLDGNGSQPTMRPSDAVTESAGSSSSSSKPAPPAVGGRNRSRRSQPHSSEGRARAAAGSILAEDEYEMPLLQALIDAGGSGASKDIVEAVGKKLEGRLTDADREPLKSGGIRWENRIQFVRLRMIERGWMEKEVPRGTWAISDAGRKQVDRIK